MYAIAPQLCINYNKGVAFATPLAFAITFAPAGFQPVRKAEKKFQLILVFEQPFGLQMR